jgi:hypothetical protein
MNYLKSALIFGAGLFFASLIVPHEYGAPGTAFWVEPLGILMGVLVVGFIFEGVRRWKDRRGDNTDISPIPFFNFMGLVAVFLAGTFAQEEGFGVGLLVCLGGAALFFGYVIAIRNGLFDPKPPSPHAEVPEQDASLDASRRKLP